MAHNWQDPAFAEASDARHLAGNPARAEHLSLLLAILDQVKEGWILDLGTGSGLVAAQMLLDQRATARVFGLDSSTAMLSLAKDRLGPYRDRVRLAEGDLTSLDRVDAPRRAPQRSPSSRCIISRRRSIALRFGGHSTTWRRAAGSSSSIAWPFPQRRCIPPSMNFANGRAKARTRPIGRATWSGSRSTATAPSRCRPSSAFSRRPDSRRPRLTCAATREC